MAECGLFGGSGEWEGGCGGARSIVRLLCHPSCGSFSADGEDGGRCRRRWRSRSLDSLRYVMSVGFWLVLFSKSCAEFFWSVRRERNEKHAVSS